MSQAGGSTKGDKVPKEQIPAARSAPVSRHPANIHEEEKSTRRQKTNYTHYGSMAGPSSALVPSSMFYPLYGPSLPYPFTPVNSFAPVSQLPHAGPPQAPLQEFAQEITSVEGSSKNSSQTSPPQRKPNIIYRIRGLPAKCDKQDAIKLISESLKVSEVYIESLAPDSSGQNENVATVRFPSNLPDPLHSEDDEWIIPLSTKDNSLSDSICIDTHFEGFTPLFDPGSDKYALDFIALHGLGGHAAQSWRDRKSSHIWIRDALPGDLDNARILTYGYRAKVVDSESFETIDDMATLFCALLRDIRSPSDSCRKPIIFAAHSLGGLILKSAIGKMKKGNEIDRLSLYCTHGILCFGVPNQGMETSHMLAMINGQQNVPLVLSLSRNPHILMPLNSQFNSAFIFRDSTVISFYETETSSTMVQGPTGRPELTGRRVILVDMWSAQNARLGMDEPRFPIQRDHSHMIKFSRRDKYYRVVRTEILQLATNSLAVVSKRLQMLEANSPELELQHDQMSSTAIGSDTHSALDDNVLKRECETKDEPSKVTLTDENVRRLEKEVELLKRLNTAKVTLDTKVGRESALIWAVRRGDLDMVEYILDRRTDPDTCATDGLTALSIASMNGHETLTQLLVSRGANVNNIETPERSALYLASGHGNTPVMRILLSAGALMEQYSSQSLPTLKDVRVTPLMNAARFGHVDAIDLLIDHGAELDAQSTSTPYTALHSALCNDQVPVVAILLDRGANPNLAIHDKSPLLHLLSHRSSRQSFLQILEALLKSGADPNDKDEYGFAGLHHAVTANDVEFCNLLLDHGANINIEGYHSQTPLHISNCLQYHQLTQLLIAKGADSTAKDSNGRTPGSTKLVDENEYPFYVPLETNPRLPCDFMSARINYDFLQKREPLPVRFVPHQHRHVAAEALDAKRAASRAKDLEKYIISKNNPKPTHNKDKEPESDNEDEARRSIYSITSSEDARGTLRDQWSKLEVLLKAKEEAQIAREKIRDAEHLEVCQNYAAMFQALAETTEALQIATAPKDKDQDKNEANEEEEEKEIKPIELKDAIGRKFKFPFELCKTWKDIEELIIQAFEHVDFLGPEIVDGHYDLLGSNGNIIIPKCWEETIRPGDKIIMQMWPMRVDDATPPPTIPPHPSTPGSGFKSRSERRSTGIAQNASMSTLEESEEESEDITKQGLFSRAKGRIKKLLRRRETSSSDSL